jgi:hypothetical protein
MSHLDGKFAWRDGNSEGAVAKKLHSDRQPVSSTKLVPPDANHPPSLSRHRPFQAFQTTSLLVTDLAGRMGCQSKNG